MKKQSDDKTAYMSLICGIIGLPFSAFIVFYYILYRLNIYEVNKIKSFEYSLAFSILACICFGIIAIILSKKAKKSDYKKANVGKILGFIDITIFLGIIVIGFILGLVDFFDWFSGISKF